MDPMEYLDSLDTFGMKMGLGRIKPLLEQMGNPHRRIPSVIVAGTNGKGSTCAMCGSVLSSLGLKVLLYTSPHLTAVNERIEIDGKPISSDKLKEGITKVKEASDRIESPDKPTYFEVLTAAAFQIGSDNDVDVIVAEVGLGGRLDATNVLDPQVSGITSISMDHNHILGEDPVSIAKEKAGIIKPSVPVIIGPVCVGSLMVKRCLRTILTTAAENGSEAVLISGSRGIELEKRALEESGVPDWRIIEVADISYDWGTSADLRIHRSGSKSVMETDLSLLDRVMDGRFTTPLIGRHQAWNMASAVALSLVTYPVARAKKRMLQGIRGDMNKLIRGAAGDIGDPIDGDPVRNRIREGLKRTKLKARFEVREIEGKTLILDGGHNVEAGWATARTLNELFPGKKVSLLISMMEDKNPLAYLSPLNEMVRSVHITRIDNKRSMDPDLLLAGVVGALGDARSIHIGGDIEGSFKDWFDEIGGDTIGLASGSFFLYGELSRIIDNRYVSQNHQ